MTTKGSSFTFYKVNPIDINYADIHIHTFKHIEPLRILYFS